MGRIILTGGIASGKSTIVETLRENGISIIDSDVISKQVFNANIPKIHKMFDTILEGSELRAFVGSIIFSQPRMKLKLEAFMHPKIREVIQTEEISLKDKPHIIDMPLYFESKNFLKEDYVILVSIPYDIQLQRLMERNGFTEKEANKRILAQLPTSIKENKSDYIIRNEGTIKELHTKIEEMIKEVFSIECKIN